MENFAFAAPPNNELVVRWLAEYSKAIKMGLQARRTAELAPARLQRPCPLAVPLPSCGAPARL
eukprot:864204-Prymnesium_polylepis.1